MRNKNPPGFLLKGLDPEQAESYKVAWANARFVTDPMKDYLIGKHNQLVQRLTTGEFQQLSQVNKVQAELKAINELIGMLP